MRRANAAGVLLWNGRRIEFDGAHHAEWARARVEQLLRSRPL